MVGRRAQEIEPEAKRRVGDRHQRTEEARGARSARHQSTMGNEQRYAPLVPKPQRRQGPAEEAAERRQPWIRRPLLLARTESGRDRASHLRELLRLVQHHVEDHARQQADDDDVRQEVVHEFARHADLPRANARDVRPTTIAISASTPNGWMPTSPMTGSGTFQASSLKPRDQAEHSGASRGPAAGPAARNGAPPRTDRLPPPGTSAGNRRFRRLRVRPADLRPRGHGGETAPRTSVALWGRRTVLYACPRSRP